MCPGSPRCLFTGKLGRAPRWTVTGMYPYGSKTPGGGEKPGSRVTLPKGAPATPRTEHLHHARRGTVARDSLTSEFDSCTVGESTIIKPNFEHVQKTPGGRSRDTHEDTHGLTGDSGHVTGSYIREPHVNHAPTRNADSPHPRRTKQQTRTCTTTRQPPQCLRLRPMTHTQKRPPPANPTRVPALY